MSSMKVSLTVIDFIIFLLKLKFVEYNQTEEISDELINKVREFFGIALGKEASDISSNSDFFLDLGGNSLDYLGLITALSKDFNVTFPNNFEGLTTPKDIAEYLRDRI